MNHRIKLVLILCLFIVMTSCYRFRLKIKQDKEDRRLESILKPIAIPERYLQKTSSDNVYLKTGWYYITDSLKGVKRILDKKANEIFYVDTAAILTVDYFSKLRLYESRNIGLIIFFNDKGTKSWSIATGRAIGDKLGLIINNVLLECPKVNSQIDFGISVIERKAYSPEEIIMFKRLLQKQIIK